MTDSLDVSQSTTSPSLPSQSATSNNNCDSNFTNVSSVSDSIAASSLEGSRTPNVEHLSKTNLYIKGLKANTVDQDLYNMCCLFGQISSTKAILDKSTGCCKGYGFVEFTSPQTAELALQELTKSGVQAQMAKVTSLYSSHHNHIHHQQQNHHHHHQSQHHHHQSQNHHHHHHQPQHHHHHQQKQKQQSQHHHQQQQQQQHQQHQHQQSMMSAMSYPRMQHGFQPTVAPGAAYPAPMCPPTSGPQWIHTGGPGQAYVIPQHLIQNNSLDPSNHAVAAAAAMHYGHIPQLASQMQGLQIGHPGGHLGGYIPAQHQWPPMWTHPIPHQQSIRLPAQVQDESVVDCTTKTV